MKRPIKFFVSCSQPFLSGLLFWGASTSLAFAQATVVIQSGNSVRETVQVQSWKSLRDGQIVKQDQDFSCGAASLATLLNGFYGQSLTEAQLLQAMDKGEGKASFLDMANALPQFGFRGIGYAVSYQQLTQLKIPVIVYLQHRKNDHFSVLRGIDAQTVWLADPSLGNRTYSKAQFLKKWETRGAAKLKGKILAILPNDPAFQSTKGYFTHHPRRPTHRTVSLVPKRFHWIPRLRAE